MEGRIYSVNRDLYTVKAEGKFISCTARGIFRKDGISPCAGDIVTLDGDVIVKVQERKNYIIRPPIANFDKLAIVVASVSPSPSTFIIDKMLAIAEIKGIEPIIIFNKQDLKETEELCSIYSAFDTVLTDTVTGKGIDKLTKLLKGSFTVLTGNSGVGKSSILNCLMPKLKLQTGEISEKLGRGRHTTRKVELIDFDEDTCIADTPGFSTVDILRYETIFKEDLPYAFREFIPLMGKCKFTSCSHTKEKGCAVLEEVESGKIPQSRLESYKLLYEEIKDCRPWQTKNV